MTKRSAEPRAVLIGRRIASARVVRGMTQQALAEGAEMPVSSLAQYETGRCLPSAERQEQLARVLRVPQDRLFAGALRCDREGGIVFASDHLVVEASASEIFLLSRIQDLPKGFQDVAISMIEVAARMLVDTEKVPVLLEA